MGAFSPPAQTDSPTRVGWDTSTLSATPVARARHRAAAWVREQWQLPGVVEAVELTVGELCTNAVRHGGGLAGVELLLVQETEYCPPGIRLLVSDYRPDAEPLPARGDLLSESGRGLAIVVALSLRWGWHRLGAGQKQVWCKLPIVAGHGDH